MSTANDRSVEEGHMPHPVMEKQSLPYSGLRAQETSESPQQMTEDVARSLRLQLLTYITKPMRKTECKKTALHRNRGMAFLHIILHLLPMAMCVALVVVNCRAHYIGEVSANVLTVFQFATKHLEVLIQASIATVVLAFVRHRALGAVAIPFGGLTVPFRITDLSLLWSLELWGCFTSFDIKDPGSFAICLLFPFAVVLAILAGPSSAVLMIPRPVTKPFGSTMWLSAPQGILLPTEIELNSTQLNSEHEYNISSSTFANRLGSSSDPQILTVTDTLGSRDLRYVSSYTYLDTSILATVPTALSVDILKSGYEADKSVLHMAQPYVYLDCHSLYNSRKKLSPTEDRYITFGRAKHYLDDFIPFTSLMSNFSVTEGNDSLATMPTIPVQDQGEGDLVIATVLSRPPSSNSNNSLLLAWAKMDPKKDFPNNINEVTACTVDASWVMASSSKQKQGQSTEEFIGSLQEDPGKIYSKLTNKININLSPEWTKRALTLLGDGNLSEVLPEISGPAISLALSYMPPVLGNMSYFDPNGETDFDDTHLEKEQYNNIIAFIQNDKQFREYDYIVVSGNGGDWTDPTTLSQFAQYDFNVGYGYDTSATMVQLSLTVILLYLLMTTAYLIVSISCGVTGSSWDSMSEIVALALNSERPRSMQNTSAGINNLETYRQPVSIRVNADRSLGLVFNANSKYGEYSMVENNEKY